MRFLRALLLAAACLAPACRAVLSPLDKVTQDMKAMKETLDSIQASLVTSVSLLQDQLTEFTGKATTSLDSRLDSLDRKVASLGSSVADLVTRSHSWDSFQHHVTAWESQLTSLDQKLDLMSRTQDGRLAEQGNRIKLIPDIDFKLDGLGRKLGELGGQVQVMDGRLLSLQDGLQEKTESTLTALGRVAEEVRNSSRGSGRHSGHHKGGQGRHGGEQGGQGRHAGEQGGGHSGEHHGSSCRENRVILEEVQARTAEILERVTRVEEAGGPTFSYLRGGPQQVGLYTTEEEDEEGDAEEERDFMEAEDKFVALFRRIATPFKRVNKRLRTMESVQDNIEAAMSDIKLRVQSSAEETKRELGDFLASSTEQQQEQTHMLEGQAAAVASLRQCCSGLAVDQARLSAQAGPVLDRLDRWMTSWQNSVGQQFERVLQQNSYDHDSHSKGHKELERLMVDGFDRCKPGLRMRTRAPPPVTPRLPGPTTPRPGPTEEVLRVEGTVRLPLVQPGPPATREPGPPGCEEGAEGVVGAGGPAARYCSAGGWTVGLPALLAPLPLLLTLRGLSCSHL